MGYWCRNTGISKYGCSYSRSSLGDSNLLRDRWQLTLRNIPSLTCLRWQSTWHTVNDSNGSAKFVPQREIRTSKTAVPQGSVRDTPYSGGMRRECQSIYPLTPIPEATRSKAWVCGLSLAGIVGSNRRSQWPCGLRRGSAAARLLGSWVRIPPGARMFVLCYTVVWNISDIKDLIQYKNGSKGKNPGQTKKKDPAGDMDVCLLWVLCVVR